jgi:hypothetical protein
MTSNKNDNTKKQDKNELLEFADHHLKHLEIQMQLKLAKENAMQAKSKDGKPNG